jgi:cytochrome c oxidase subunit 2
MSSTPRRRLAPEAIIAAVVVILLAVLVPLVVYSKVGDSLFPPTAVTVQAKGTRDLYNIVFGIAVAIFVAVEGLIIWSVIRYRRKPGDDELPPQTHGNNLIEIIWTIIPTAIVLFLFALSFNTLNTVDAVSDNPDIRVTATAAQFQWQFTYMDANGNKIATQSVPLQADGGGLGLPVGKNIQITLQSPDVIHAFYVPQFLFKRDVIPGQLNRFQITIDADQATDGHPAIYRGQCAELCGTGHRTMLFNVIAMSPGDFTNWLQALVAKNNATPPPAPSGAAVLNVAAQNITFDTHALTVPANAPFSIDFKNEDPAGIPHNIEIRDSSGKVLEDQPTIDGGTSTTYNYTPLPPGTYTFICKVHPIANMTGTLTVH